MVDALLRTVRLVKAHPSLERGIIYILRGTILVIFVCGTACVFAIMSVVFFHTLPLLASPEPLMIFLVEETTLTILVVAVTMKAISAVASSFPDFSPSHASSQTKNDENNRNGQCLKPA